MILAHGEILENKYQSDVIASLPADICKTLSQKELDTEQVIVACDILARRARAGEYDEIAKPLLEFAGIPYEKYIEYAEMFSAEKLRTKVNTELAGYPQSEARISEHIYRRRAPLGVLLHIAAGNVDVLPAYSVVEGLLAGNINLLKLPSGDAGLSVKLLHELISVCPELCDYIYVFDVPSTEIETIKELAEHADAVVVWGGDAAVSAAHRFIKPNTRLIAWGHKLSFAYAEPDCSDEALLTLARDICRTNQMLCSSCQGIYLDTDSDSEQELFAERFFEMLKKANRELGAAPMGMRAKNTLKLYTDRLEGNDKIFSGEGVSVCVKNDSKLELSYLFRNVWVKKLPSADIISALKPNKGHLQTCALLLGEGEKKEMLAKLLIKSGVTRITNGEMSAFFEGEAHDGSFALKEYSRVVDIYR